MTEELLAKAKEAQSPEELLTLLQENGMEDFTSEDAEGLYTELHMTGELTDEELENVSGGGCVSVGGQKYRVVTNLKNCFTGHYYPWDPNTKTDHMKLRKLWTFSVCGVCGTCNHLAFTKAGTGYCEVEHGLLPGQHC